MYTFVFIAQVDRELSEEMLSSSKKILQHKMPSLNKDWAEGLRILSESNCGWFWLTPGDADNRDLISEIVVERYAAIAFGNVLSASSGSTAQAILDAYGSGGASKVQELEGCFSAVIVDRHKHEVIVVGDLGGQRTLRYYTDEQTLIISPHDIALVATGSVPMEFDYVSATSSAIAGWSLRGKSLLKQVHACRPYEYIFWSHGKIQHIVNPILNPNQRIEPGDYRQISRNLDCLIETARANMRSVVANESIIGLDLSAGIDSRTVMSLLLSVKEPSSKILPICVGEANSLDVQTARRIAKLYRIPFSPTPVVFPSPDEFLDECDLLAFATNGDGNSSRFMIRPQEGYRRNEFLQLHGWGGELFRGYFYPPQSFRKAPELSLADANQIVSKKILKSPVLKRLVDFTDELKTRLSSVLNEYSVWSTDGYDLLDVFNLYEPFTVKGETRGRMTWRKQWSPFFSRQAIQLAFMMPSPICDFSRLHQESIRRFAPKAYWIRINGEQMLPFEGRNLMAYWLRKVDRCYWRVFRRTQRILHQQKFQSETRKIEQLRIDYLAKPLIDVVYDLMMSERSFARTILGRQGLESVLQEHQSHTKNHLNLLSSLIIIERWRILVEEIAYEAAK